MHFVLFWNLHSRQVCLIVGVVHGITSSTILMHEDSSFFTWMQQQLEKIFLISWVDAQDSPQHTYHKVLCSACLMLGMKAYQRFFLLKQWRFASISNTDKCSFFVISRIVEEIWFEVLEDEWQTKVPFLTSCCITKGTEACASSHMLLLQHFVW